MGENGEPVEHRGEQAAIREMMAFRAKGQTLRAIAAAAQAKGFTITHAGVAKVLAAHSKAAIG